MTTVIADIGVLGTLRDRRTAQGGARMRVENPASERIDQVHATDPVSTRALLPLAFMARFVALGRRGDFVLPLAVARGNEPTVALPRQGGHDLFEPPPCTQAADGRAALEVLHDDLCAVLRVADAVRGRSAAAHCLGTA